IEIGRLSSAKESDSEHVEFWNAATEVIRGPFPPGTASQLYQRLKQRYESGGNPRRQVYFRSLFDEFDRDASADVEKMSPMYFPRIRPGRSNRDRKISRHSKPAAPTNAAN
ncbi:MAG: hypothetical protein AAFN70_13855, partial [Planctomycetota bacterium]